MKKSHFYSVTLLFVILLMSTDVRSQNYHPKIANWFFKDAVLYNGIKLSYTINGQSNDSPDAIKFLNFGYTPIIDLKDNFVYCIEPYATIGFSSNNLILPRAGIDLNLHYIAIDISCYNNIDLNLKRNKLFFLPQFGLSAFGIAEILLGLNLGFSDKKNPDLFGNSGVLTLNLNVPIELFTNGF